MYQFQDLATLLALNILQHTNNTTNNAQAHQLTLEQNNDNAQESLQF